MRNNKTVILVVDDEERIVRVLRDYLTAVEHEIICAYNGQGALDTYYEHSTEIDLILLDVMMPGLDGLAVLDELRRTSLVPVIMLTAKGEEYDQIRGFRAGADDYIVKPFSQSVLALRIDALMHRVGKSSRGELRAKSIRLDPAGRRATLGGKLMTLTPREFDLLAFFLMNQRQILSREQLLNSVWGYDFEGELRTVDTHVKQLRGKLGDCAAYVKTVFRVGYRFEVDK